MMVDVLVVGAGPVGLTMAAELARYGVSVRVVERAAQRNDKSKALVLWSRSLELIDRMGCAHSFIADGHKVVAASIIAGDGPLAHIPLDSIPSPYNFALMLPQNETERLMEAHLAACGTQVERGVELTGFTPGADGVTAVLRHPDGKGETLAVSWLIGCDGAHSTIRHGLGAQFEGDTLPTDWILADVHLAGDGLHIDELTMYWRPEGLLALFPITPDRYRIIADVGPAHGEAHRPDPTLEEVQALLDRRGAGHLVASRPVWLSAFRINERKVKDYRAGRVFLVGDAAHIHSPAGGQGMNTGMQDACNLAWKLALVCHEKAVAEPLLDSYSAERSEVGRQVLANAGHMTTLALLRNGVAQAVRNHLASLLLGLSPVRRAMTGMLSELSIGYPNSPITQGGAHPHGGPAAGERAPVQRGETPVGSGTTPRFALFAAADAATARLIARFSDLLEPAPRAPFASGGLWLVRPDGYVAATARPGAEDTLAAYLDGLVGPRSP